MGRIYEINGELYDSVTTILGQTIPQPWLVPWVKAEARKAILNYCENHVVNYLACDPEGEPVVVNHLTEEILKDLLNTHWKIGDESMRIGLLVHDIVDFYHCKYPLKACIEKPSPEAYISSVLHDEPKAACALHNYFEALRKERVRVWGTELKVWDETLRYAGTQDNVSKIGRTFFVGDLKTFDGSKRFKPIIKKEHLYQTEAYRRAFNLRHKQYGVEKTIRHRYVLYLDTHNEGNYHIHFVGRVDNAKHWARFKHCLGLFERRDNGQRA